MPLDPQVVALLGARRRNGVRPVEELTVSEARAATRAYARLQGEPEAMAGIERAVVPGPAGDLRVRIYHPHGEPPHPCLVHFHGGGWVSGDLATYDRPSRRLANTSGCVVVTVDHRRAPEHKFPAPLDDCLTAVRWVHGNAEYLGVDPGRINVTGDSAGGNLAAATCIRARDEGGPEIGFQALIYPATDARCETSSYETYAEGFGLQRGDMRWCWNHYLTGGADADDPLASPLRAADLGGLPPALVVTAEYDPLRDDGELYAARLMEAGVPTRLSRYDGMIHAFYLMGGVLVRTGELIEEIGRCAGKALGRRSTGFP